MAETTTSFSLTKLETTLDEYLVKKAPALPANAKDVLVKIAPYLAIVAIIFCVPALLALFGLGAVATLAAPGFGLTSLLGIAFLAATMVLEAMAVPGLFARSRKAWNLMFYATLLNAVYALVTFSIGGLVIGTLLGLYILFQLKSYYK